VHPASARLTAARGRVYSGAMKDRARRRGRWTVARIRRSACRLGAVVALLGATASATREAGAAAYFGDLHAHSALSDDATNPPDAFFRVARDVAGLDFVVLSDHDAFLTENEWEILKTTAASFHVPGRFVTFSAIEWTHRWHMNVYFAGDDESACASRDCPEAADFYDFYGPRVLAGDAAAHVNHPADLFKVDWAQIEDEVTNAVEVWNTGGAGDNEPGFGNALWALRAGFKLGLVGVSDDHHSEREPPLLGTGLTGCPADALTRENLLAALRARRCWATSGARIVLDLDVDGTGMGGERTATLGTRVPAEVSVDATAAPVTIELLRNGDVVDRVRCRDRRCVLRADVRVDEPHTFLYARVEQGDGARAWSSPVWIRGTCRGGTDCLASRLASGGGDDAPEDCLAGWLLPGSPAFGPYQRTRNRVRCTDGDPACDAGGTPGECLLRIGLCFGTSDRRRASCAPAIPDTFEVLAPPPATDRASVAFQNRAALLAAFQASADPSRDLPSCSAPSELRAPLGTTTLEIVSTAGARSDRDVLTLECVEARGARRLPRLLAEEVAPRAHRHGAQPPDGHTHTHTHGAHRE